MPDRSRWRPILEHQLSFMRKRARGLVDLARDEGTDAGMFTDPTERQRGQPVRVVLEKIRITDDQEPWWNLQGEFKFYARAWSPDNGKQLAERRFPWAECYKRGDSAGENEIVLEEVIFEGFIEGELFLEVGGVELDTFDVDDKLDTYKRTFLGKPASFIGSYHPDATRPSIENMDGWQLWYRIEYGG